MNTARMSWWSPVVPKSSPAPQAAELAAQRAREAARHRSLTEGSQEAFGSIYREHAELVFRVACRHTASRELAEEVAQETFLVLLRNPGKFDPERGELGPFLAGIARQLARRALERAGRTFPIDDGEEERVPDEAVVSALHEIIRNQQWQHLHDAVASLPDPYREIVVMHHLEELSYEEIAEAVGCPVGTVRSRLSRGRDMLARKLAGRHLDRPIPGEQTNSQARKGGARHATES